MPVGPLRTRPTGSKSARQQTPDWLGGTPCGEGCYLFRSSVRWRLSPPRPLALAVTEGQNKPLGDILVGRQSDGSVLTPQNQYVTPAGDTVEQTGRPMDLAVSPDGRTAVDPTKSGDGLFTVVDLVGHKILQQYSPPRGVGSGKISADGLLYSKDGRTLWAAEIKNILKLAVAPDGTLSSPTVVAMPTTGAGGAAVPTDPQGRPARCRATWPSPRTARSWWFSTATTHLECRTRRRTR